MDGAVATDGAVVRTTYARLHTPVCVFVIAYGAAKLAELAGWSRLHRDAARMLGLRPGTVTALLAAGKGAELLLTAVAALALARRRPALLLVALAGWAADLAVLTTVAGIEGDRWRLLEHGLAFIAFAGLTTVTYAYGPVRAADAVRAVLRRRPDPAPGPGTGFGSGVTRDDLPVRGDAGRTRLDLPARGVDVTRQDLPVRPRRPAGP